MGMNPFSPYPHYAWFAHGFSVSPPRVFSVHQRRSVTHRIVLTTEGHAEIRIAAAGTETAFHTEKGDLGFFPLDHDGHTISIETSAVFRACELLIPGPHIRPVRIADGVEPGSAFPPVPVFRDVVLRACVLRLSPMGGGQRVSEGVGDEVAARQIVVRLCHRLAAMPPEWPDDTSVFTSVIMRDIVAFLDATLATQVPLERISASFGLSPGHFARKFHRSTGLSVGRFMNKRRIGASFAMLADSTTPLSRIALDLGFSSQSHFTRLFSSQTGFTPRQFRQLHRTPAR